MSFFDVSADKKRTIEVVAYDPKWPELFEVEAKLVKQALGSNCIVVHHIGSTAVPEPIQVKSFGRF